ncbi:MAG TPA: CHAT domain-containing protein [Kouleothrix sp.]|uniref:CHAT domain-containing protein n=1 Tax=Kouleothrix sp. TaxID=2779161 RepID=UPI002B82743C|nr:CHAT domain-containing protein [Kouleothrix sp.]HRC74930.1 CHAT domain-containing protein [Kouleothrix sp.]
MTEMLQIVDPAELAARLRAAPAMLPLLLAQLSDADAAALVEYLKGEADRHWWINANQSVEFADLIVAIGRARGDVWQEALGTMARGDALKFVGNVEEAWRLLGHAGELFGSIGDEVGWARTRIGRLVICQELQQVRQATDDAEIARGIFQRYAEHERLFGLYNNLAMTYSRLGNQQRALELYLAAQQILPQLSRNNAQHTSLLATNLGFCHHMLGEFGKAKHYYEQAKQLFEQRREPRGMALIEHNLAHIAMLQGQYRTALSVLHHVRDSYRSQGLALDATHVDRDIVEIYLLLNRYTEARDLAQRVIGEYRAHESAYREGLTLIHLATAEANLRQTQAAAYALKQAETLFASIGAPTWHDIAQLRRGQLALRTGDTLAALDIAAASIASLRQYPVEYGTANVLRGQSFLALGAPDAAASCARAALAIGKSSIPTLRYDAHLLLGAIAERLGQERRALRHYRAAIATIDQLQRRLTITLRSNFLDTRGEAFAAIMRLYLGSGQAVCAFEALEGAKSQNILGYLSNREQLRWRNTGAHYQSLVEELSRLRAEHRWFYHLAYEQVALEEGEQPRIAPEQARAEVALREGRMRAITEQLYLESGDDRQAAVAAPQTGEVQQQLAPGTLLVEFYNDGNTMWAFTLGRSELAMRRLPTSTAAIDQLIAQLRANVEFALKAGAGTPLSRNLARVAHRILGQLYEALLAPLAGSWGGIERLIVVPYGALHYLPFHLLYDGEHYAIERREVVVLPAAGLLTRRPPQRAPGARVLCHSWQGRLSQTLAEARIVHDLFGGEIHAESAATRARLGSPPTQLLHIAAHGQHRLDQPDLSYIELGDGQLYTDDLLQHDLSYELVTLSACETGRAHVAAGDELIGLGRGFLYAGAGALITSLWQIPDALTTDFMQRLYTSLHAGASKTAALRAAQRAIHADAPDLHPAFWGAFQLAGDPRPLSGE